MSYTFANRMGNLQASAIREILKFTSDPSVISFAAGNPAPEAFPTQAVKEITAKILTQNPIGAMQYSISEGYPALRQTIKDYLKNTHHTGTQEDDVIITSGAQQAIELSCKIFCNEGDVVLCENPSFIGSLNSFKSFGARLVGVDMEEDGIDLEKLEQAIRLNPNAKLLYLIPNFQNPTGQTMSLVKRKAVYELAVKHHILILEDNPYGELRFAGEYIPNIKSFDTTGSVIYVGSFSKVVAPGIRVGYACANKAIAQKLTIGKQASDVHTNILSQMICDEFMNGYDFPAHLEKLREIYRKKCSLMTACMKEHFNPAITYIQPQGGLFLWCTLPEGVNMPEFCLKAVENKVAVVPGTAFLPDADGKTQSFRMNYSTPTDAQIQKGVEILGNFTKSL